MRGDGVSGAVGTGKVLLARADGSTYTITEAAEKYGMTKSNICVIVKTNNLTKVKVGARNLKLDE